jgi:hypothetical protein
LAAPPPPPGPEHRQTGAAYPLATTPGVTADESHHSKASVTYAL